MIDIVVPQIRPLYQNLLNDMHRMRYDAVVTRWGWDVPGITPGCDRDQFDTDDTIYFLHLDQTRQRVLGCCRLNPTSKPYMIPELFADFCDYSSPPAEIDIWEPSRLVIASDRLSSREEYNEIFFRMGVALCEYAVRAGIRKLAWFANMPLYLAVNDACNVEPLGRPRHHEGDGKVYVAALSEMTEQSIVKARRRLSNPTEAITFALTLLYDASDEAAALTSSSQA